MKTCLQCNIEFNKRNRTKFCSSLCASRFYENKRRDSRNLQRKINSMILKQKLVDSFGGSCQLCGYNKCLRALCFHHLSDKLFTLDSSNLFKKPWEEILVESAKCQLLCQNCHAILHENERNLIPSPSKRSQKLKTKTHDRKRQLIINKGSRCEKCYTKYNSLQAYTFHHIDKKNKLFEINCLTLQQKSLISINNEVSKCKLLCFNCHMEEESDQNIF